MASLYTRGPVIWARLKMNGKWIRRPAGPEGNPYRIDGPGPNAEKNALRNARKWLDTYQRGLDTAADGAAVLDGPLTVRQYAATWINRRREADLDWKNDRSRLEHHVHPVIGDTPIAEVRAKNIAELVHRWRFTTKLAQRSVYNVYSVVSAMFRDAAIDGEIEQTPCILTSQHLGPLVDKDPEWRDGAVYTRDEAETIISDERIPYDRRMYYAFMLLAGIRPGEIAVLRWRRYDSTVEPLGRLVVAPALNTRNGTTKGTKTGAVRHVPVHATLAAMIAEWKLTGWEAAHGHAPGPDDLICPLPPDGAKARRSREGEPIRTGDYAGKKWRDLKMLGCASVRCTR